MRKDLIMAGPNRNTNSSAVINAPGAERDVTNDIKDAEFARKLGQPIEHGLPPSGSFRAKASRRESGIRARSPVSPFIRGEKPEKIRNIRLGRPYLAPGNDVAGPRPEGPCGC